MLLSLENRLSNLPEGFVSKKLIGALANELIISSWVLRFPDKTPIVVKQYLKKFMAKAII